MLTLFLLLIFFILLSCFFSGSETGFISWNRLKVSHAAAQGNWNARIAMRFVNNRERFLSTTLVGNNVCNIAATLVFAIFFERINNAVTLDLSRIPSPESWFLTPALLLFSEILPKSLYRTYPFHLTMKSVPVLAVLYFALSPFFWVFNAVSKIFHRRERYERKAADVREEIVLVAVEGVKRGAIFDGAARIMKNTLNMKGKRVESISVGLDDWKKTRTVYRSSQILSEFGNWRCVGESAGEIVIFDEKPAAPVGYVSLLDAAAQRERGGIKTFGALLKPLPRIRHNTEILTCFRQMPPESPRYHLIVNRNDTVVGILDKTMLYEIVFAE